MNSTPAGDPPRFLAEYPVLSGAVLLVVWATGLVQILGLVDALPRVPTILPLIVLVVTWHRLPAGAREGLGLMVPLTLFWSIHSRALDSWWIRDDPCHLTLILDHGIWKPFISSIGFFLTPWLSFSLGLDFLAFGVEPEPFYLHQLLSFSALLAVAYGCLRLVATPIGASLALGLFVSSPPAFAVAQLLMNRHYLEGLIFALAAVGLYQRSLVLRKTSLAIVGALLYLLATTAKEVFVPLVLLLPFVASGDRTRRWRHGVPYVLVAALYTLWRFYMLGFGNSLSAYGTSTSSLSASEVTSRFAGIFGVITGWQALLVILALGGAVAAYTRTSRNRWVFVGVLAAALFLPLAPVASVLEPRHLFLVSFVVAVALALPVDRAWKLPAWRAGAPIFALVLLLFAQHTLAQSSFYQRHEASIQHHRQEGELILQDARSGTLLTTINHSTYLECLARLRHEVLQRAPGPSFCGDACGCGNVALEKQAWRFQEGNLTLGPSPSVSNCAISKPLVAHFRHDEATHRISWQLGPYEDGTYDVLLVSAADPVNVSIPVNLPRKGNRPYWLFEPLRLKVRYRSPEGWQTYSPTLTIPPGGEATIP